MVISWSFWELRVEILEVMELRNDMAMVFIIIMELSAGFLKEISWNYYVVISLNFCRLSFEVLRVIKV